MDGDGLPGWSLSNFFVFPAPSELKPFPIEYKNSRLRVGKRFVEAARWFRQLAGFEDRPAIEAFHIFRVGILGDELRAGMAASSGIGHNVTPKLNKS